MRKIIWLLCLLIIACGSSKQINTPKIKQTEYLPIAISYIGIEISDTVKSFIKEYFVSRKIKIINIDDAQTLAHEEILRAKQAGNLDTQEKFASKIFDYIEYVCNMLVLDFKISSDSQKVYMSWRNVPWAPNPNKHPKLSWIYLHNYFISVSEPPFYALKALCDSILTTKTLYQKL